MDFQDYFPVWNRLTAAQQNQLLSGLTSRKAKKGTICIMAPPTAPACF